MEQSGKAKLPKPGRMKKPTKPRSWSAKAVWDRYDALLADWTAENEKFRAEMDQRKLNQRKRAREAERESKNAEKQAQEADERREEAEEITQQTSRRRQQRCERGTVLVVSQPRLQVRPDQSQTTHTKQSCLLVGMLTDSGTLILAGSA